MAAHPDDVQARSESSPKWEEFHREARDYGATAGNWPVSLAAAIVRYADQRGADSLQAREFTNAPGRGATATVNGHRVAVGNQRLLERQGTGLGALAIETADVVLIRSDPLDVPTALAIGRGTLRKMRQNLGWAIGYNSVALPIAAGVFAPAFGLVLRPELAGLAMSGSKIIVVANALTLKRRSVGRAGA